MLARRLTRSARNAIIGAVLSTALLGVSAVVGFQCGDGETWGVYVGGGALAVTWGEAMGGPFVRWTYPDGLEWRTFEPELLPIPVLRTFGTRGIVGVPLWPIPAALLARAFLAWRRCPRFGSGQCQRCGYDMTGNVSGICPECGRATAAK